MANIQSIITNGNGNVLIGTTTDNGYKLRISGSLYTSGQVLLVGATNVIIKNHSDYPWFEGQSASAQLFYGRSGQNPWGIGADATYAFRLWDSSFVANYFGITVGGNVLIGTTTDVGAKLYVDGGIRASSSLTSGGLLEFTGAWSASPYNGSSWVRPPAGVGVFLVNNAISRWAGFKPNDDFVVNSDNLVVNSSTGNVGIGTTNPQGQLSLNSQIPNSGTPLTYSTVQQNVLNGYYTYGESPNLYMRYFDIACVGDGDGTNGGGNIRFLTNPVANDTAVERMRITSAGNVGIGTTSPTFSNGSGLVVHSDGASRIKLSNPSSGQGATDGFEFIMAGLDAYVWNYEVGPMLFGTSSAERMRITSDGNVGIGNTSPKTKLHLNSSVTIPNSRYLNFYTAEINEANFGSSLTVSYTDSTATSQPKQIGVILHNDSNTDNTFSPALVFGNKSTSSNFSAANSMIAGRRLGIQGDSNWHKGELWFWTATGDSIGGMDRGIPDGYPVMVMDSLRRVGIGTTGPASILHISTSGANAYSSTITKGSNMKGIVNTLSNNADDMVGIYFGTGTDAAGSHWSGITGSRSNSAVNWGTQLNFYTHNDDLSNITDATQKMVIKGNGNVGIGTTAPTDRLHVRVSDTYGAVRIGGGNGAGNSRIFIEANGDDNYIDSYGDNTHKKLTIAGSPIILSVGNVLVGTTTNSSFKLDVAGNFRASTSGSVAQMQTSTNASEVLRLSNSGGDSGSVQGITHLGINFFSVGTNSPVRITAYQNGTSGYTGGMYFSTRGVNSDSAPTEAMRITHDQLIGLGPVASFTTTHRVWIDRGSSTYAVYSQGSIQVNAGAIGVGVTPSATSGRIDAGNDIVAYSTSDQRLKENITPITNALDKVKALTGVEFDWKEETKEVHGYEGHDVGVIAQEVQAVLPEAVRTNDSGYLSVRYEKMIALLVEANKELASRVEELEKKLK